MTDKQTNCGDNPDDYTPLAKRFLWAESSSSVERLIFILSVTCAILFILDFIVHRHAYAPGEGLPGFYAVVGFVAFTLIVVGAKQLRRVILRNEQYYAPYSVDAEAYPDHGLEQSPYQAQNTSDEGKSEEGQV